MTSPFLLLVLLAAAPFAAQSGDPLRGAHKREKVQRILGKGGGGGPGGGGGGTDPSATVSVASIEDDSSLVAGGKIYYNDKVTFSLAVSGTLQVDSWIEAELNCYANPTEPLDEYNNTVKYTTKRRRTDAVTSTPATVTADFLINALNVDRPKWPGTWNKDLCTIGGNGCDIYPTNCPVSDTVNCRRCCDDCDNRACFNQCGAAAVADCSVTAIMAYTEKIKGTTYTRRPVIGEYSFSTLMGPRAGYPGANCLCRHEVDNVCNGANGCTTNPNNYYNTNFEYRWCNPAVCGLCCATKKSGGVSGLPGGADWACVDSEP